jgi:putative DNA primase/helicase
MVNATAGQYRWLRGDGRMAIAEAPAELVAMLRAPKAAKAKAPAPASIVGSGQGRPTAARPLDLDDAAAEAVRKYALPALDGECRAVRQAGSGKRNAQLNESALKIASLVAAGALDAGSPGTAWRRPRARIRAATTTPADRDDRERMVRRNEQPSRSRRDRGRCARARRPAAEPVRI